MSRSFIDMMKHIVATPSEWPKHNGHLAVFHERYSDVRDTFVPPKAKDAERMRNSIFGVKIVVDDTVPPNEIRFVSWQRNPDTHEYEPRVYRIVNVSLPNAR